MERYLIKLFFNSLGIPVFVRRLTNEEVKEENEVATHALLDPAKEVSIFILGHFD
jgi:hypothetical protein